MSATNWHLPRALPTSEQQRRLLSASKETEPPCCCSCFPSTTQEGVQGGVRPSVLQGIWWDRSLDSWMFLGTDFMTFLAFWLRSSGGSDGKRLSTMWETWIRSLGREVLWRRKWQPTPVLLPRKLHGQRSLVSVGLRRVGHD